MFYVTDENGNPIPIAGTGANPNLGCLRTKLLWTNPNPNNAFNSQNIVLSSGDYDFLLVEYTLGNGFKTMYSLIVEKGFSFEITRSVAYPSGYYLLNDCRTCTRISDTEFNIGNADVAFINANGSPQRIASNNSDLIPYKIYGIYKSPAMIYTGEELFEGANVNINNGVVSVRQLVADVTFGSASSFEITDLDLQGDGGVYDIIIEPPLTSAQSNFKFRLNNNSSTSAYVHSFFDIDPQSKALSIGPQSTSDGWAYLGAYGPNPNSIFMTLMSSQGRAIWTIDTVGYLGRLDFEKFFGYTVTANVTSMQILANSTLSAGLKVKIYRRLS